ncbi:hypothetical protein DXV76_09210 [Rhodobacteraceae bacterium CCMM004]|nr:hypothetical protein DXV76_09210 [Rhodobacteraceae bacterium CCMM004]
MSDPRTRPDYFREIREQLRYWPFTIHQIDETLDVDLIAGRGRQILFQAINARSLTAFVGSGLSASYGRLTWKEWQTEQFGLVKQNWTAFEEVVGASLKLIDALLLTVAPDNGYYGPPQDPTALAILPIRNRIFDTTGLHSPVPQPQRHNIWRWLRVRRRQLQSALSQTRDLAQTFTLSQAPGSDAFPGGEPLPIQFEISKKLHEELRHHVGIYLPPVDSGETPKPTDDIVWSGTRADREAAAPKEALEDLKAVIDRLQSSEIEKRRDAFKTAFDAFARAMGRPQSRQSTERLAKMLLIDERAHAAITLFKGLYAGEDPSALSEASEKQKITLETALGIFDPSALKRDLDGIRENQDLYRVMGAYRFDTVFKLIATAEGGPSKNDAGWKGLLVYVENWLRDYVKKTGLSGDRRKLITPSSRFLVPALLALIEHPRTLFSINTVAGEPVIAEDSLLFPPVAMDDFTSRRSIIANRFDPLAKTVRQLGIRRYITTNYDFEIERYFQDMGYRKFPPSKTVAPRLKTPRPERADYRSDPVGGLLIDQTFARKNAAELVAFSLDQHRSDAGVFHLHGRASSDDKLIITERDYMNLYLWEDEHRDTVDEGITMAFSSAPLVFFGLGMSEADLLRPLRQFMSNRDRIIGYHAVALLPAEKPAAERAKFAATCYLRYGVHTIFYGTGHVTAQVDGEVRKVGLDWLYRVLTLTFTLKGQVSGVMDGGAPPKLTAFCKTLVTEVGLADYDPDTSMGDRSALALLYGYDLREDAGKKRFDNAHIRAFADAILGGAKIQNCTFAPVRPRGTDDPLAQERARHNRPDTFVDGGEFVGFYVKLLEHVTRIVLTAAQTRTPTALQGRQGRALITLLDGIVGGLLTGSLNATLVGLEREWRSWWQIWQQSPPHRKARFQRLPVEGQHPPTFFPARFIRHKVDSTVTNLQNLEGRYCGADAFEVTGHGDHMKVKVRKADRTHIRAFDGFVCAVHRQRLLRRTGPYNNERLLFTVAAHRGLGKGSFLSAMSSSLGLSLYCRAAWPEGENRPFIVAAAFVNLSYATEVASTFDMLIDALIKTTAAVAAAAADDATGTPRDQVLKRLHDTFDQEARYNDADAPYAVSMNSAAKACTAELEGKIAGVSRLQAIRVLLKRFKKTGKTLADRKDHVMPRFLIYFGSIELFYTQGGAPKNPEIAEFLEIFTGPESDKLPIDVVFVGSEMRLGPPFSDPEGEDRLQQIRIDRCKLDPRAEESVTKRIRTGRIDLSGEPPTKGVPVNHVHFARPVSAVSLLCDNFPVLAAALYINQPPGEHGTPALSNALKEAFRSAIRNGRLASDDAMRICWCSEDLPTGDALDAARRLVWHKVQEEAGPRIRAHAQLCGIKITPDDGLRSVLRKRLWLPGSPDREQWRQVRRRLGLNRFSITIVMAAAEQIVIHADDPVKGGEEAERFILTIADQVRTIGRSRREEMVLQAVLESYRRMHVVGDPDADAELHLMILRHLGLIGSPISSSVLVRLPEVRDYFHRIGVELPISRRRFLARALTVLAYRGLIFRLDPHPRLVELGQGGNAEDKNWPPDLDPRFALHRIVQRHAVAKLGAGQADPLVANSFAPRLYPAMPSEGTGLSRESYGFLRSLLIGLSQYPDIPHDDLSLRPWIFTTEYRSVRVQALRAALSLARSTLSAATLSRFGGYRRREPGTPKRGVMETYKVRLRWIIRMAWELAPPEALDPRTYDPAADYKQISALYRDEIVWLYNELGVISLAQGSLTEALGFLRQAAEFNECVEGRARKGPIYDNIDLNHAIVQLERGRLGSAQKRLERIARGKTEADLLRLLAEGYQCVLAHIRGEEEGLSKRFERLTERLVVAREVRASAIFLNHHARLMAKTDRSHAGTTLTRAQAMAETGGHEDIRHQIELARITMRHRYPDIEGIGAIRPQDALFHLKEIEVYGKHMGIWNLQVDALRLRAELLLSQGETTMAGSTAVRAMAIAKRNRMTLRLNSALTVYAEVLLRRGDRPGAEENALLSLEMAKATGYSLETSRAQHILSEILGATR